MNNIVITFVLNFIVTCVIGDKILIQERENKVWRSSEYENNTSIRPFTIKFKTEVITDLKYRLRHYRKPSPPLEGVGFEYGFNTNQLDSWLDYWINDYDFAAREKYINKYSQYKTNIQGLDIHFLWIKPKVHSDLKVLPLLMLHGFPGSVLEFYDAIPLITAVDCDRNFVVELVVPSLPGFAFSDGATRPGLGAAEMAVVFKLLMQRLGHDQFYVQGGDWGSHIGSMIAVLYPKKTLGFHTNYPVSYSPLSLGIWFAGSVAPSLVVDSSLEDRLYPLSTIFKRLLRESGYLHIQATKPDTIGAALSDSPAGLLTWIFQLFSTASRKDNYYKANGGLNLYPRKVLIDNLMMYWIPNSFTTAARIYAESYNMRNVKELLYAALYQVYKCVKPTPVPVWTVHTKNEIQYQSPKMLEVKFPNLLNSTVFDDYGHFLALEQPEIFSDNVLTALKAYIKWNAKRN